MQIKKGIVILVLMLAMLGTAAIAADSDNKSRNTGDLQAYADRAACTLDFHSKVISDTADKVPQATPLKDWAAKISSDATQLKNLAAAGDPEAFHKFVKETLQADLKAADAGVRDERKKFKDYNVSEDAKEALKEDYNTTRTAFASCEKQNNIKVAQQRVNVYTHFLSQRQDEVDKLAKRNISTTELTALITQAQTVIVKPLQDAVSSGDANMTTAALKRYCLFSGCKDGINFHFSAKFEQARLAALLESVKPQATSAGVSSDIAAAQAQLDAAKAAIQSIGTSDFATAARSNQVWNPIKQAAQALKKLRQDFMAAKKAEMQAKRDEMKESRQEQRSNRTAAPAKNST